MTLARQLAAGGGVALVDGFSFSLRQVLAGAPLPATAVSLFSPMGRQNLRAPGGSESKTMARNRGEQDGPQPIIEFDGAGAQSAAPARGAWLRAVARAVTLMLLGAVVVLFVLAIGDAAGPSARARPWAVMLLAVSAVFWLGVVILAPSAPTGRRSRSGAPQPLEGGVRVTAPLLVAAMPDPCVLVDRRGVVLEASASARELFPLLRSGSPLSFAARSPDVVDALERVLDGGGVSVVEVTRRQPMERVFELTIAPLDAGRRIGALVVAQDLTARRQVEQMRVDFIANISHELRTPLATVMGFIETLQGPAKNDPAARERFLAIMQEQALRMKRLINDLLSLSRIEAHAHVRPSGPVDLAETARHVVEALQPMAGEAGVSLGLEEPAGPVVVLGDRDELIRVVENLVVNAIKYGGGGKRVDVLVQNSPAAGAGPGEARPAEGAVAVRDYGQGVTAEHAPRLTERFYRVNAGAMSAAGGAGLGLAIVKHIVTRHRGRMHIDSKPGEGSTFQVVLPLAEAMRPQG